MFGELVRAAGILLQELPYQAANHGHRTRELVVGVMEASEEDEAHIAAPIPQGSYERGTED